MKLYDIDPETGKTLLQIVEDGGTLQQSNGLCFAYRPNDIAMYSGAFLLNDTWQIVRRGRGITTMTFQEALHHPQRASIYRRLGPGPFGKIFPCGGVCPTVDEMAAEWLFDNEAQ